MVFGFAVNLDRPEGVVRWLLHGALVFSAVGVFTVLARPLLRSAWEALRHRRGAPPVFFLGGRPGRGLPAPDFPPSPRRPGVYPILSAAPFMFSSGAPIGA